MSEHVEPSGDGERGGGRRWVWLLVVLAAWAVVTGPVLVQEVWKGDAYRQADGGYMSSEQGDQEKYHQPVIERFEEEWPRPNLRDYQSTTGPGYHLLMAGVHGVSGEWRTVKVVNALIGAGMVAALWWALLPLAGARGSAVLALPLACSSFTASGSIWLTTDNLAWLCVIVSLGLVLLRPFTAARGIGAGVACAAGVFVRQVHIWPIAPLGAAGLLASPLARFVPRMFRRSEERRWSALAAGVVGAAIPVAVLGWLVWLWGDLTPPAYREMHDAGWNPATFAFALTCFGVFGVWYMPLAWAQVTRLRVTDWAAWVCVLVGVASAVAVETDFQKKERSFGWIWEGPVKMLPEVGGRSIVLTCAAPVGALVLLLLWRRARDAGRGADGLLVLLTLLGWACAQSLNTMAWQRYFEPLVLIGVGMLVALGGRVRGRVAVGAVVVLAACQAVVSGVTIVR